MEKIAKLTAFEPSKDKHGNHKTFEGGFGTLWKFIVTFDNGDKGEASSSRESPSWKIGDEFSYELCVNGVFSNIRNMTPVNKSFVRKSKTLEDWQFYAAQRLMKAYVERAAIAAVFRGEDMSEKERDYSRMETIKDAIDDVIPELTKAIGESLESNIWFLSINSAECLIHMGKIITVDSINLLNKICLAYKK